MTPRDRLDLMTTACRALWGRRWQTEACENLGRSPATLNRWLRDEGAPGPDVLAALHEITEARIEELQRLSNYLRRNSG